MAGYEFSQMSVETDLAKTHRIIFGEPGTGKTTFAAAMKDKDGKPPFFIMTEKGNGVLRLWGQRIPDWAALIRFKNLILGEKKAEFMAKFGSIAFDVIGDLDEMAAKYAAEINKVKSIADLPHGKGWVAQEEQFKLVFDDLLRFMPCIFIAHVEEKQHLWQGETVNVQKPRFSKRIGYYLNGKTDFIMYTQPANSKKEHREIAMVPETGRWGKSRYPHMNRSFRNHKNDPGKTWAEMNAHFQLAPHDESSDIPEETQEPSKEETTTPVA